MLRFTNSEGDILEFATAEEVNAAIADGVVLRAIVDTSDIALLEAQVAEVRMIRERKDMPPRDEQPLVPETET